MSDSPFNFDGLHVPFLYATNGEVLWFHDIRRDLNRSRRIHDFYTPAALEEMLGRDFEAACARLYSESQSKRSWIREAREPAAAIRGAIRAA